MANLTFKTFSWPVNPETYHESYEREPVYDKAEDGSSVFSGMGPMKRVITGSGAFFGENASSDFSKLAELFADGSMGSLVHPVWGARNVYFTGLSITQPPKADYVAYSFTFTEADSDGAIPK